MSSKNQKLFIRVVAIVLAVLMAGSVLISIVASTAGAASQSALDQLKEQREAIQQQLKNIQAQINSLEYDQAVVTAKKQVLDQRIELTQNSIENLNDQIIEYGHLIDEKELEVQERQRQEEEQWDLYKIRMRAMEENGTVSYYAILFGANSFSDMLTRIDIISSIMNYDEKLYDELVAAREATEAAKANLEATREEMEGTKVQLQEAEVELQVQLEEAEELIRQIQADIDQAQAFYDEVSEEEDKLKDKIYEMEEALRRQNSYVVGTGRFIWPTDYSNRVTSPFGIRNTGIAGASTNHKGIDIGAGYGANVFAADSGTVLTATYSSSYGNYVTISHGNGYTTLYAHMSRLAVKAGDTVTQGQVIGYAGSTGISNGPHLHFEIWLNGTRVNPLNYFSSWVRNW